MTLTCYSRSSLRTLSQQHDSGISRERHIFRRHHNRHNTYFLSQLYALHSTLSGHRIIIPYKEALFVSSCKKVPCVCLIKVVQFPVRNDCYSHCWVEGHHSEVTGHGQSWGQWSLPLLDPGSALPGYFTLTFTTTYCNDDMKFFKSLHGKCSRSLRYFQIPLPFAASQNGGMSKFLSSPWSLTNCWKHIGFNVFQQCLWWVSVFPFQADRHLSVFVFCFPHIASCVLVLTSHTRDLY